MKARNKTVLHILLHVGKLLEDRLAANLGKFGLHHGQAMVLRSLRDYGPILQTELSRGLKRSNPTMTNMLKPMERRGWITRTVEPRSNRALVVRITTEGKRLARRAETVWRGVERDLSAAVGKGRKASFLFVMEALRKELGGIRPKFKTYERETP